jgi:hypothetical protein
VVPDVRVEPAGLGAVVVEAAGLTVPLPEIAFPVVELFPLLSSCCAKARKSASEASSK